jgi:hypothetical protein
VGTGGTEIGALERTLRDLLFPELWAARDELLARVQAQQAARDGGDGTRPAGGH